MSEVNESELARVAAEGLEVLSQFGQRGIVTRTDLRSFAEFILNWMKYCDWPFCDRAVYSATEELFCEMFPPFKPSYFWGRPEKDELIPELSPSSFRMEMVVYDSLDFHLRHRFRAVTQSGMSNACKGASLLANYIRDNDYRLRHDGLE